MKLFRYASLAPIALLLSACALFPPRIDGTSVDFRLWAFGQDLQHIAFVVPVSGTLTEIEVLRPTADGRRQLVWRSHGSSAVAALSAYGHRESIGYGSEYPGFMQDVAAPALVDGEIYVVYVTLKDETGRERRGGTVFLASEREGVDYGCDSVRECMRYIVSTIT